MLVVKSDFELAYPINHWHSQWPTSFFAKSEVYPIFVCLEVTYLDPRKPPESGPSLFRDFANSMKFPDLSKTCQGLRKKEGPLSGGFRGSRYMTSRLAKIGFLTWR